FAVVSAFLLYLRTLAPGVLPGDSGEFQFAAWGWTLVHPTGYPLYLLFGGLWEHLLPFGNPAYRLNLLSAVLSALTIGLAYRIFYHITRRRGASLIGAFTLAVSSTFWSQATESEVYALNSFLVALLIWLALKWQANRSLRYSAAWALVLGLALAHHRSIILLIPGFAAFFTGALYDRARRLRALPRTHPTSLATWFGRDLLYVALVGAPLLLYAYIPLRAGATPYARLSVSSTQTIVAFENNPAGWLADVSGTTFDSELRLDAASVEALQNLPARLIQEFNPLGAALGVFGIGVLIWRRRVLVTALTLFGFIGIVVFDSAYHIGDISDFYTPAYLIYALWMAAGIGAVLDLVARVPLLRASLIPTIILLGGIAVLPLQNLYTNFIAEDRTLQTEWEARWRTILGSPNLPAHAILISNDRDEMTPMWYLQIVEGLRPDVLGLFPLVSPDPAYANTTSLVDNVIDSGHAVLLIKSLPGITLRYRLEPTVPELYRVVKAPPAQPQYTSDAVIGNRLEVPGFSVTAGKLQAAGQVTIAVLLRPVERLTRDYTTSLQIQDDNGNKIAQGNDHQPGGETYPTSQWKPGEQLQDEFQVQLPSALDPGLYHVYLRVYVAGTDESLGDLTEIGTIEVLE
ncbi:MAG: DUF2723 domain-containing protein, partial [Anaerolineae bacterium]